MYYFKYGISAHLERSTAMKTTDKSVERRIRKRRKLVCDAVAFVRTSHPGTIMVAKVIDISPDGLSLSHFGNELPEHTSLEMDIVLPGGDAFLPELPGEITWDSESNGEPRALYPNRRCGIRFRNLTVAERSYVGSLIRHYTENNGNEGKSA
jgi:hypothetical protein